MCCWILNTISGKIDTCNSLFSEIAPKNIVNDKFDSAASNHYIHEADATISDNVQSYCGPSVIQPNATELTPSKQDILPFL